MKGTLQKLIDGEDDNVVKNVPGLQTKLSSIPAFSGDTEQEEL